jgi:hypothetical protein
MTVSNERGAVASALRYAAAGWPVFPLRPGSKEPATPHGFEDASTDPERIAAWWRWSPAANVGIATGAPGPDVLDVDTGPAGSGWDALGRLLRAGLLTGAQALVSTRSGGRHVYYAGTAQRSGSLPRHRLDFRAAGGYVVAPPSYVEADRKGPAGRYEVLDSRASDASISWAEVRALLAPPAASARRTRPVSISRTGLPARVAAVLSGDYPDRSRGLWHLCLAAVRDGLDDAAVHELAAGYLPALEKYGDRLAAEVDRCLAKLGSEL